jgi:hypothetical protein
MRQLLAATASAEKAALETDRRVQAGANLAALYESADVILLCDSNPSQAVETDVSVFTFHVLRRFKDSGPQSGSDAEYAYVRISHVAQRRLYERLGRSRVVLFLRTVPTREWHAVDAQQQLDNIDHRRFVPVENNVSVLAERKDIIAFLEERAR